MDGAEVTAVEGSNYWENTRKKMSLLMMQQWGHAVGLWI